MKDMTHHRQHIQKKVLHDVKKESSMQKPITLEAPQLAQPLQESVMAESQDIKRKATRDYVRRMSQRNRFH